MIVTIEHTEGGRPCACCPGKQDNKSVNIKTQGRGTTVNRIRLCTPCGVRIRDDLIRAVWDDKRDALMEARR